MATKGVLWKAVIAGWVVVLVGCSGEVQSPETDEPMEKTINTGGLSGIWIPTGEFPETIFIYLDGSCYFHAKPLPARKCTYEIPNKNRVLFTFEDGETFLFQYQLILEGEDQLILREINGENRELRFIADAIE